MNKQVAVGEVLVSFLGLNSNGDYTAKVNVGLGSQCKTRYGSCYYNSQSFILLIPPYLRSQSAWQAGLKSFVFENVGRSDSRFSFLPTTRLLISTMNERNHRTAP